MHVRSPKKKDRSKLDGRRREKNNKVHAPSAQNQPTGASSTDGNEKVRYRRHAQTKPADRSKLDGRETKTRLQATSAPKPADRSKLDGREQEIDYRQQVRTKPANRSKLDGRDKKNRKGAERKSEKDRSELDGHAKTDVQRLAEAAKPNYPTDQRRSKQLSTKEKS